MFYFRQDENNQSNDMKNSLYTKYIGMCSSLSKSDWRQCYSSIDSACVSSSPTGLFEETAGQDRGDPVTLFYL